MCHKRTLARRGLATRRSLERVRRWCQIDCRRYSARISCAAPPPPKKTAGLLFIRTAIRLFNYEKPISRLVLLSRFFMASAHVSGQLEFPPWLTNQWVSLIRGRLKSFGRAHRD